MIPGQVDPDLWNEHYARYLFAARLARFRRVLDLGCGAGYGAHLMSECAQSVTALDSSAEALALIASSARLTRIQASAIAIPLASASIDLVVAFEVIEHLEHWPEMLVEVRRVLAPRGQFLVSTPNLNYYRQSRAASGPNPFHAHEFTLGEFRQALTDVFPHVSLFTQNHTSSVVFRPIDSQDTFHAETQIAPAGVDPEQAHFYLAVCAASRQTGAPTFVYVPSTANVLKEREDHIQRLEGEVTTKTKWLDDSRAEHALLVTQFRQQTEELKKSNLWADQMNAAREEGLGRIAALQQELAEDQKRGAEVVAAYEERLAQLDSSLQEIAAWAKDTEQKLTTELSSLHIAFDQRSRELEVKCQELAAVVTLLDQAETTVVERTHWAQSLEQQIAKLESALSAHQASRWTRLGKTLGLGPKN